jgi:hypothetical protein
VQEIDREDPGGLGREELRAHRRRVRPTSRKGYQRIGLVTGAPMRPGLLTGDLQPSAEIAGLDAGRLIPGHSGARPQETEPAKKIHSHRNGPWTLPGLPPEDPGSRP